MNAALAQGLARFAHHSVASTPTTADDTPPPGPHRRPQVIANARHASPRPRAQSVRPPSHPHLATECAQGFHALGDFHAIRFHARVLLHHHGIGSRGHGGSGKNPQALSRLQGALEHCPLAPCQRIATARPCRLQRRSPRSRPWRSYQSVANPLPPQRPPPTRARPIMPVMIRRHRFNLANIAARLLQRMHANL